MTELTLTIVLLLCTALVGEALLWRLFRRRVDPVIFPADQDASQLGFFRLGRMRVVALAHTIILCVWMLLSVLWLW